MDAEPDESLADRMARRNLALSQLTKSAGGAGSPAPAMPSLPSAAASRPPMFVADGSVGAARFCRCSWMVRVMTGCCIAYTRRQGLQIGSRTQHQGTGAGRRSRHRRRRGGGRRGGGRRRRRRRRRRPPDARSRFALFCQLSLVIASREQSLTVRYTDCSCCGVERRERVSVAPRRRRRPRRCGTEANAGFPLTLARHDFDTGCFAVDSLPAAALHRRDAPRPHGE